MAVQVTVNIPEYVFEQARLAAERERRTPEDVLSDALLQAYPAVHVHPQREKMLAERAAFERQLGELLTRYEGQYVAIHNGEVIDHAQDKLALALRVKAEYPEEGVLIKLVTAEPDRDIQIRSPRLTP